MTIDQVRNVTDLNHMESALPDDGMEYTLRHLDGLEPPRGKVVCLRRIDEDLYAIVDGDDGLGLRYAVTGPNAWVLCERFNAKR